MICPKCGAEIPRVNESATFGVVICPTYSCENILAALDGKKQKMSLEKLKAPPDVTVENLGDRLHIKAKSTLYNEADKGCMQMLVIFMVLMQFAIPFEQALNAGILAVRLVLFLPCVWLFFMLMRPQTDTRHEVFVTPRYVQSHPYGRLFFMNTHWRGVRGAYVRQRDKNKPDYDLWVIGKRLKVRRELLAHLREDQAVYMAQVINSYLSDNAG